MHTPRSAPLSPWARILRLQVLVALLGVLPALAAAAERLQVAHSTLTATNAAILGIKKMVGTIATGKIADLIAVPGNPLKEISLLRRVEFVMQGGRVACSRIPDVAKIS